MIEFVVLAWTLYAAMGQPYHQSAGSLNDLIMTGEPRCLPWQTKSVNNSCKCDTGSNLFVTCTDDPYYLKITNCYCVTYKHHQFLVGSCMYTCHQGSTGYSMNITAGSMAAINEEVCQPFKRRSAMCGHCLPHHSPPVYSYSIKCVNCTSNNWGKFLGVSLLPLTAFFAFVLLFRISATSPSLSGLIFFCQILTCAPTMRELDLVLMNKDKFTLAERYVTMVFTSLVGVWNLDFFRLVYTPFCLQPYTITFHVLAMDYLTAVYPLLLIVIAYILVELYDYNVRFAVWFCKPFVSFFIRFRRQWNIRYSLVDAFATFILLSYVKILSVSVDILLPTLFYGKHYYPEPLLSPFMQPDVSYFGRYHLPWACLALFFLLTFTLLPMLLLFLYPCSCFQSCLNRTGLNSEPLRTFMDSFQGHYKDGTEGTYDLRFFSGVYLLVRGLVYLSVALAYQVSSYGYTTIFLIGFTAIVALARPFKKFRYNLSDVFFLTIITMLYVSLMPFNFSQIFVTQKALVPVSFVLILAASLYTISLLLPWEKTRRVVSKGWFTLRQMVTRRKQSYLFPVERHDYGSLLAT